jgi:O-acetyl-ADP-ribose deacetylase (regulator of RNase III)
VLYADDNPLEMVDFSKILNRVDQPFAACYNQTMNQVLRKRTLIDSCIFQIVQGDITKEEVDAIVNAANAHLQHGGGVAGVISRRGGPEIQQESDEWVRLHGPVSHSEPGYTSGGRLPCQYVIHAVGPVWGSGDEDEKLKEAVAGSLRLADHLGLRSISLPAISTGIFGYPKERAARVINDAVKGYFSTHEHSVVELVRLVLFDQATIDSFLEDWDANK